MLPHIRYRARILERRDLLGDELSIVLDPADQRRAPRVLPGQAKVVEAGRVRHPATVAQAAIGVENGKVDPGVVGPVPRRPDDGVDLYLASVLEAHCPAVGVDNARFQLDAVAAPELSRAGADQ